MRKPLPLFLNQFNTFVIPAQAGTILTLNRYTQLNLGYTTGFWLSRE